MSSATCSGVQPDAKSVSVGPTRTVVVRTPVPSSSIVRARAATSIAAFVAL